LGYGQGLGRLQGDLLPVPPFFAATGYVLVSMPEMIGIGGLNMGIKMVFLMKIQRGLVTKWVVSR